ncbi:phage tail protein [Brucella gallinifaecis]|uniref:Phage tail protein n=1 Tax=Brucella gallinifaecis TaxID=215590 RepID=A0A502BN80_9HYPH|nr:phage tail protein [Brucella gallinifaecis]TPF75199.1 phage tail protein [Brucella gallinifaecis]
MAIFSAIAAVGAAIGSFIGGLGVIGSFLLKTAVGIGANLIAQAIAGKPKEPTFSINGTLQGGGDLPRSFIIGKTATAGSLVWANTWGKDGDSPNAYLTQVIALSDLPVKGLLNVWVNNERVTLDLATPDMSRGWQVKEYRNNGDNLWVKFYDGTQTVADSFLVNTCSNGNRAWSSNRVGRGVAYVIVTARVSKNMFSGIPSFKFEVDGYPMYDPTRDSSVGGVGAQRLSDPSTWGGDGDHLPAVQNYNLLRGIYLDGKWFYGVQGMSSARLPTANWIAAINKCRQIAGSEPQYRSGGEITIDAPLSAAIEAINTTCQGRIAEIGGVYHMYLGAPDAPVVHFTDDDILSTDEQSFSPFFGLADTINGISVTYPSPADGWVIKTAPPLYRTDLEARHGNRRLMASIELSFVCYPEQVQRLQKSALEEGQRARRHTHVLPPKFWAYAVPGVVFAWTSKRNGYVNKLMRVDGAADRANLDIMVDLTEVDPTDYDWNSSTDYKPPIDGAVGPMRPLPQPIVDFSAEADVAQDADGNSRRCAIRLGWDGTKEDIDFVRFEVRFAADLGVVYSGRADDVARGSIKIAPGILLPNSDYDIRAVYATFAGNRLFEWSDWIRVRTRDILLGPLDIYPFSVENFNTGLQEFWRNQNDNLRRVDNEVSRLTTVLLDLEADSEFERAGIREEIGVQGANYRRLILVEANERKAQVTRLEELDAQLAGNIANVQELAQATATELDAVAQTLIQTQTQVGNISANGYLQIYSEAAPSGSLSRVVFAAIAEVGGDRTQGALAIEAIGGGKSRVIVDADEFYVSSSGHRGAPLAYVNGELTLRVINFGSGFFDEFQSRNGALRFRGHGDYADIRLFTASR